mmetsp:Transcript_59022/g.105271  ORF Transcript_59022/g.105271 Transcript_59022/m.105271 type:complete len:112 (-) Transcript_59022:586-921(-)
MGKYAAQCAAHARCPRWEKEVADAPMEDRDLPSRAQCWVGMATVGHTFRNALQWGHTPRGGRCPTDLHRGAPAPGTPKASGTHCRCSLWCRSERGVWQGEEQGEAQSGGQG